MAPMRCRSPTNFMRWQHRSVQFKAPQLLSWKIPSSDQQRDTTCGSRSVASGSGTINFTRRNRAITSMISSLISMDTVTKCDFFGAARCYSSSTPMSAGCATGDAPFLLTQPINYLWDVIYGRSDKNNNKGFEGQSWGCHSS